MRRQVNFLLEQLTALIESSNANQSRLCERRLIRVLLNEFQDVLKDATSPIQAPLLNIVSELARFHMSTMELRCYLRLLRRSDYPSNLISTLFGISEHQHSGHLHPRYYADFNSVLETPGHLEFRVAGDVLWPSTRSYAVSTWIRIMDRTASMSIQYAIPLFAAESVAGSGARSMLVQVVARNGSLYLLAGGKWVSLDLKLDTDQWYHVVLLHSRSRLNLEQRAPANVVAFVNGVQAATHMANYPTPAPLASVRFSFNAGAPADNTHALELGNVYLLRDVALDELQATLLYGLGPNYAGQFTESLAHFQTFDLLATRNVHQFERHPDLLDHLGNYSLAALSTHITFFYCARGNVVVQGADTNDASGAAGITGLAAVGLALTEATPERVGGVEFCDLFFRKIPAHRTEVVSQLGFVASTDDDVGNGWSLKQPV